MRNILLLCCLFSFQAFAYENHCENENATVIARLEKELDDCKGNYDVVSAEALILAHRASARCMIDVADKLFDNFFVKNIIYETMLLHLVRSSFLILLKKYHLEAYHEIIQSF